MQKQSFVDILENALLVKYPLLPRKRAKTLAVEIVLAPDSRMVTIDDTHSISAEDLKIVIADELNDKPLAYRKVEPRPNIDNPYIEANAAKEYFDWLEETTTILRNMNDGYVTQEDAVEKQTFLRNTEERETELFLCLSLYDSCFSSYAERKAESVRYKLQKLREMRTAIMFLTKEGIELETTRSEFDSAKPYYIYFKNLRGVPFGYDAPKEKKEELGIRHDLDKDLSDDFDRPANLKNKVLDALLES